MLVRTNHHILARRPLSSCSSSNILRSLLGFRNGGISRVEKVSNARLQLQSEQRVVVAQGGERRLEGAAGTRLSRKVAVGSGARYRYSPFGPFQKECKSVFLVRLQDDQIHNWRKSTASMYRCIDVHTVGGEGEDEKEKGCPKVQQLHCTAPHGRPDSTARSLRVDTPDQMNGMVVVVVGSVGSWLDAVRSLGLSAAAGRSWNLPVVVAFWEISSRRCVLAIPNN